MYLEVWQKGNKLEISAVVEGVSDLQILKMILEKYERILSLAAPVQPVKVEE